MMRLSQSLFVALALGVFVLAFFALTLAPLFAGIAISSSLMSDDLTKSLIFIIPVGLFVVLLFGVFSGAGQS